jgi:uncharacterized membrane protein YdfJ with MMPL/SSD domain
MNSNEALARSELPDAAPQLNVVMRVGGSIGVAVLTVVLARSLISRPRTGPGIAGAFGTAYWWALAMTAVSVLPGLALLRAERRARARERETDNSLTPELLAESVT